MTHNPCETCKWFDLKNMMTNGQSLCWVMPPVVSGEYNGIPTSLRPYTNASDTCEKHKPRDGGE